MKWVAVSGGFDPFHIGHVRYLKEAKKLGDKLVVIINNDNWLKDKKGFVFMPENERKELIESFSFVDRVVLTDHQPGDPDRSVVRTLAEVRPDIFANGGDRFADDIPEAIFCKENGIEAVFNIGEGGKVQSSSWMINHASRDVRRSVRPWGEFYNWDSGKGWHLKTIYVKPNSRLSLQYHHHRAESWLLLEGEASAVIGKVQGKLKTVKLKKAEFFTVPKGSAHRLQSKKGCVIAEVSYGNFDENDIVRIQDDFGRDESKQRVVKKKKHV